MVLLCFFATTVVPNQALAQVVSGLPVPGSMVSLSPAFTPAILRGIRVYPDNALKFDFIVDSGDTGLKGPELKDVSERLIKYFLTALTIPEDNLWVNLSPHEQDRIIPNSLAITDMGTDMLSQDYLLKQITASLIYPEDELGKQFWQKIYKKAYEQYGTTNIPVDTFNKVWIMPDKAEVYVKDDRAFVVESKLKVMLEEDYLAMTKNSQSITSTKSDNKLASEIVREIVIPALEKEVNSGKNFAQLRQIYNSLILAYWFKNNLKESIVNRVYSDQSKIKGVDTKDISKDIYNQYVKSFEKGVCDFIKVEYDQYSRKNVPRKYFSGGIDFEGFGKKVGSSMIVSRKEKMSSSQIGQLAREVKSRIAKLYIFTSRLATAGTQPNRIKPKTKFADSSNDDNVPRVFLENNISFSYKKSAVGPVDLRELISFPFLIAPDLSNVEKFSFGEEGPFYLRAETGRGDTGFFTRDKEIIMPQETILYWDLGGLVRLIAHEIGHSVERFFPEEKKEIASKNFNIIRDKINSGYEGYRLLLASDEENIINPERKRVISATYFRDSDPSQFLAEFFRQFLIDGDELRESIKNQKDADVKRSLENVYALFKEHLGQEFNAQDIEPLNKMLNGVKENIAIKAKEHFQNYKESGYPYLEDLILRRYGITIEGYEEILVEAKKKDFDYPTYKMIHQVTLQILEQRKLDEKKERASSSLFSSPFEVPDVGSCEVVLVRNQEERNLILDQWFEGDARGRDFPRNSLEEEFSEGHYLSAIRLSSSKKILGIAIFEKRGRTLISNEESAEVIGEGLTDVYHLSKAETDRGHKNKGLDLILLGYVIEQSFNDLSLVSEAKGVLTVLPSKEALKGNYYEKLGFQPVDEEMTAFDAGVFSSSRNSQAILEKAVSRIKKERASSNIKRMTMKDIMEDLRGRAARFLVRLVFLDLDNTLFSPNGYIGSETQKEESVKILALNIFLSKISKIIKASNSKKGKLAGNLLRNGYLKDLADESINEAQMRVYPQGDKDEESMADCGFFELSEGLTKKALAELEKGGAKIIAFTARPALKEKVTLYVLNSLGIINKKRKKKYKSDYLKNNLIVDNVIFTSGEGKIKVDKLKEQIDELSARAAKEGSPIEPGQIVFIDDKDVNTNPVNKENLGIDIMEVITDKNLNYKQTSYLEFIEFAKTAIKGVHEKKYGQALWYLINAYSATETSTQKKKVKAEARRLLSRSKRNFEEFQKKTADNELQRTWRPKKINIDIPKSLEHLTLKGLESLVNERLDSTHTFGEDGVAKVLLGSSIGVRASSTIVRVPSEIVKRLGYLEEYQDVKYGLRSGKISHQDQAMHDALYKILTKYDMKYRDKKEIALNFARMKQPSAEIVYECGVITERQFNALISRDSSQLLDLSEEEQEDFVSRLKSIIKDYDKGLTSSQKGKMLKRFVPLSVVDGFSEKYDTSRDSILLSIFKHPNFPFWIPKFTSKAQDIKALAIQGKTSFNPIILSEQDVAMIKDQWFKPNSSRRKIASTKDLVKVYTSQYGFVDGNSSNPVIFTEPAGPCFIVTIWDSVSKTGFLVHLPYLPAFQFVDVILGKIRAFAHVQDFHENSLEVNIIGGWGAEGYKDYIEESFKEKQRKEGKKWIKHVDREPKTTEKRSIALDASTGEIFDVVDITEDPQAFAKYNQGRRDPNLSSFVIGDLKSIANEKEILRDEEVGKMAREKAKKASSSSSVGRAQAMPQDILKKETTGGIDPNADEDKSLKLSETEKEYQKHYSIIVQWAQSILENYQEKFGGNKLIFIGASSKRAWQATVALSDAYGVDKNNIIYLELPRNVLKKTNSQVILSYLEQNNAFDNDGPIAIFDNAIDTGGTLTELNEMIKQRFPQRKIINDIMRSSGPHSFVDENQDMLEEINLAAVFAEDNSWMAKDHRRQTLIEYEQVGQEVTPVFLTFDALNLFLFSIEKDENIFEIKPEDLSKENKKSLPLVQKLLRINGVNPHYTYDPANAKKILEGFIRANSDGTADRQDLIFDELVKEAKVSSSNIKRSIDFAKTASSEINLEDRIDFSRFQEDFKRVFPLLDLNNALKAPPEEALKDEKELSSLKTQNTKNYLKNQEEVRIDFLRLILDFSDNENGLSRGEFLKRFIGLHKTMLLGHSGDSVYLPGALAMYTQAYFKNPISLKDLNPAQRKEFEEYMAGNLSVGGMEEIVENRLYNIFSSVAKDFKKGKMTSEALRRLSDFYFMFMNVPSIEGFLFKAGNQSLVMNMVHGALRLYKLKGGFQGSRLDEFLLNVRMFYPGDFNSDARMNAFFEGFKYYFAEFNSELFDIDEAIKEAKVSSSDIKSGTSVPTAGIDFESKTASSDIEIEFDGEIENWAKRQILNAQKKEKFIEQIINKATGRSVAEEDIQRVEFMLVSPGRRYKRSYAMDVKLKTGESIFAVIKSYKKYRKQRFDRELGALRAIGSEHAAEFYGRWVLIDENLLKNASIDEHSYMLFAQEWVGGVTLQEYIQRLERDANRVKKIKEAVYLAVKKYALAYRKTKDKFQLVNISPKNIMIYRDFDGKITAKIIDTGGLIDYSDPVRWVKQINENLIKPVKVFADNKDFIVKEDIFEIIRNFLGENFVDVDSWDSDVGGIDFNAENMNVTTTGESIDFNVPLDMQGVDFSNVEGFIPIIINIAPVTNVNLILGLQEKDDIKQLSFVSDDF